MYLEKFLKKEQSSNKINLNYNFDNLLIIINSLSKSATQISKTIFDPENNSLSENIGIQNSDGDLTKNLDVEADKIIKQNLTNSSIKWYASEEQNDAIIIDKDGDFSICIDPLDGSSNIDTNAPIGTIFGIYASKVNANETILQKGENLISSGFFVYGPRTLLILTIGNGTSIFQLNKDENFVLIKNSILIPEASKELSVNFSNLSIWPLKINKYILDCIKKTNAKTQNKYNMRWIGSLVADCYRIIINGGVFLYPQDQRNGYEKGRLRLVYEANPIAFLIEQAGGLAVDGRNRILTLKPELLHERVPLIFGSRNEIKKILK